MIGMAYSTVEHPPVALPAPRPGVGAHDQSADVLIVDDDPAVRDVLLSLFADQGYRCDSAVDGADGVRQFERLRPALAIVDVKMPGTDGLQFLRRAMTLDPDAAIIVLTGFGDVPMAVDSLRMGAYDFLLKPASGHDILSAAERALEWRAALRERRAYEALRDRQLAEATSTLTAMAQRLEATYAEILQLLAVLADRQGTTPASIHRVPAYAELLAAASGVSSEEATAIRHAALLRDIGQIVPPADRPADPASHADGDAVERHPETGRRLLEPVPGLQDAAVIVQYHHERWDGTGYPAGLRGDAIPLGARIVAVAEALDTLTAAYAAEIDPTTAARDAIRDAAGTQFDPTIVTALMSIPSDVLEDIRRGFTPDDAR